MNGTHVRSKLKIRNRILAIAVAFLLLTLMVPKMSFADGATDQSKDIAAEEVNTAEDNAAAANEGEPAANAVTVTGTVTADSTPVEGATVSAYKEGNKVGNDTTASDGNFSVDCGASVVDGDHLMLIVQATSYAFEVVHVEAGATDVNVSLNSAASTTIKPYNGEDTHHAFWGITTRVSDCTTYEQFDEQKSFAYSFPVGGTFQMTHNAKLLFSYVNSLNQTVNVEIKGNGAQWFRAYYWGFQDPSGTEALMKVGQNYTLVSGTYTIALVYLGQAGVNFSSADANHDGFHFTFVKNGATVQDLTQASFNTTTHAGTTCSVKEDGSIQMYFEDGDDVNAYEVIATVKPIAKAGYKVAGWTCNGETFKVGDSFDAELMATYNFVVTYEVDASKAPATGDFPFVWVIVLAGIALASVGGVFYFRKNR